MTTAEWMQIWWWWLIEVAATFAVLEFAAIWVRGAPDWTLSDCIRRWSKAHHWIPAVVVGVMVALCIHWFMPA